MQERMVAWRSTELISLCPLCAANSFLRSYKKSKNLLTNKLILILKLLCILRYFCSSILDTFTSGMVCGSSSV